MRGERHVADGLKSAAGWVGSRQHSASRSKARIDAGLGNGDALLFHRFVHARPVGGVHFVKFVNGCQTEVSQHQGTCFEGPAPVGRRILHGSSGEPCS